MKFVLTLIVVEVIAKLSGSMLLGLLFAGALELSTYYYHMEK